MRTVIIVAFLLLITVNAHKASDAKHSAAKHPTDKKHKESKSEPEMNVTIIVNGNPSTPSTPAPASSATPIPRSQLKHNATQLKHIANTTNHTKQPISNQSQSDNITINVTGCALGVLYNWAVLEQYALGVQDHSVLIEFWEIFEEAMADIAQMCGLDARHEPWLGDRHLKLNKDHARKGIKAHEEAEKKKEAEKKQQRERKLFTPGDALDDADHAADAADVLDDIVNDGTGIPAIPTYAGENKWLAQGTDLVNCATAAAGIIAEPENPLAWVDGGLAAVHMVGDVYSDVKQYLPKPVTNAVSDVGHFFGGLFNDVFGSSETSELEQALGSEEMANMQNELAESNEGFEASEYLESLIPENFESSLNEASEQMGSEEAAFIQVSQGKVANDDYMNLVVDFLFA